MPADYDLVVLGGTLEGRLAAMTAAGYGARVALIEPPGLFFRRQQARYLLKGLHQIAAGHEQQAVCEWFEAAGSDNPIVSSLVAGSGAGLVSAARTLDWGALVAWSAIAAGTQMPELAADGLSASGIDFILAMPEQLSRQLVVTAADRTLSARAVLAAFGTVPRQIASAQAGDQEASTGLITGIEPLLHGPALPEDIAILGDTFEAITWAEALNSLGVRVTLVMDRCLRHEDSAVRAMVRSQLRSAGISEVNVANFQPASQPLLSLGRRKPALVLPGFVYQGRSQSRYIDMRIPERPHLSTNRRLQTAHPRVFACGSLIRGRNVHVSVARHEAQVAVWNALFVPTQRVNYNNIARGDYRFARAGLIPKFAREGRSPTSKKYRIYTASSPNSADLSRVSPLPEYCKLITKGGRLQSISLIGQGAGDLIEPLATLIGLPVSELASISVPTPPTTGTLMELVRAAVAGEVRSHWQPNHWRRDWAENWFNWRRSR